MFGSRLIRFGVTAVVGGILLHNADLAGIGQTLVRAAPLWIVLAVFLYLVDRLLAAVKWRVLFRANERDITLGRAFVVYLQSSFLGAALPSTVGVDAIRAGMVQEEAGTYGYAVSSVVAERALGMLALGVCAVSGLLLFGSTSAWLPLGGPIVVLLAIVCAGGLIILFLPALSRVFTRPKGMLGRIVSFLDRFARHLRSYGNRRVAVGSAFGIALLQQYLFILINWILAISLGLSVPIAEMLWIWPIVMIAVRLPLSILGFGVREAVIYQFFSQGGMSVEQSVTLGVVSGGLDLLFVAFGGLLVLSQRHGKWKASASR